MHAVNHSVKTTLVGVALVVGSCLSLPFGAAIATMLFADLGAWGVAALRVSIAAVLVWLIARPRLLGWNWAQWRSALLLGVILAGMNGFFYAAIERIPLGPAVAIQFLGPLTVAAVMTRRLRDGLWLALAVVAIALLGVDGMAGVGALDLTGVGLVLVAAAFWAFYIRIGAKVGTLIPGMGGVAVGLAVAAVLLLPFGVPAGLAAVANLHLLPLLLLTALLSSVIPYSFEIAALRRLPQRVFGVLISLEPVFATLAGWLLLGQHASPLRLLAIVLVVAASVGITAGVRKGSDALPQLPATTGAVPVLRD